eukprot:4201313-Alexandrium_andersonii.AAC.1
MARARRVGRVEEGDPRGQVSTCVARGHPPRHSRSACPRRGSSPGARGPAHGPRESGRELGDRAAGHARARAVRGRGGGDRQRGGGGARRRRL